MRPGQQNKRGRGRNNNSGNNNRKGQNPLSRTYDSSGPDVKIRGTAQTVADKYMSLARDAQSSGDRVMAENYLQHAEHYNRIIAAAQAQMQERYQREDRDNQSRDDQSDDDQSDNNTASANSQQGGGRDDDDVDNNSGNAKGGNRRSRTRSERATVDPDSPQPVIEGVPAEVALGQDGPSDGDAAKPSRRARRPRRTKASEGGDEAGSGNGDADSGGDQPSVDADGNHAPETAAAE